MDIDYKIVTKMIRANDIGSHVSTGLLMVLLGVAIKYGSLNHAIGLGIGWTLIGLLRFGWALVTMGKD